MHQRVCVQMFVRNFANCTTLNARFMSFLYSDATLNENASKCCRNVVQFSRAKYDAVLRNLLRKNIGMRAWRSLVKDVSIAYFPFDNKLGCFKK